MTAIMWFFLSLWLAEEPIEDYMNSKIGKK